MCTLTVDTSLDTPIGFNDCIYKGLKDFLGDLMNISVHRLQFSKKYVLMCLVIWQHRGFRSLRGAAVAVIRLLYSAKICEFVLFYGRILCWVCFLRISLSHFRCLICLLSIFAFHATVQLILRLIWKRVQPFTFSPPPFGPVIF